MSWKHRTVWWGLLVSVVPLVTSAADARRGEALYVGSERMENGGAPCLACHGVAGHGLARAASFGPDLTGAHASYGPEDLAAALQDVPFPSMQPVYNTHALTPEERAVVEAAKTQDTGHLQLGPERLASWARVPSVGWTYIVVGPSEELLAAGEGAR